MNVRTRFSVLTALLIITALLLSSCSSVTLYYRITFISDGECVDSIETAGSSELRFPDAPKKLGMYFVGWFTEPNGEGEQIYPDSYAEKPLKKNIKLYAYWSENSELANNGAASDYTLIISGDTVTGIRIEHDFPVSVVIPEYVTSIADGAFAGANIASVTVHNGVTAIGTQAFKDCRVLSSVKLPTGLETIADQTFSGCKALTEITIPDSVTMISYRAFSDCSSLSTVNIGKSSALTTLGSMAFIYCSSLKSIRIPQSTTLIRPNAFKYTGLTAAYFDDPNNWISGTPSTQGMVSGAISPAQLKDSSQAANLLTKIYSGASFTKISD